MGTFTCQHEPALVRWAMRADELKTVEREFGLKKNGDVVCLRRDDTLDREGHVIASVLVGIPAEQPHLAKTVAAKYAPEAEAAETDITEPAAPKKARGKKGAK